MQFATEIYICAMIVSFYFFNNLITFTCTFINWLLGGWMKSVNLPTWRRIQSTIHILNIVCNETGKMLF